MNTAFGTIVCPTCSNSLERPKDREFVFCWQCGTRIDLRAQAPTHAEDLTSGSERRMAESEQAARLSGDKLSLAEKLTQDAVRQAADLASSGADPKDVQAAIEGARMAMEALDQAKATQQIIADAQAAAAAAADSARIAAATQARLAEETDAMLRESSERRQREEEERQAQAKERAKREKEARARAEREARARQQAAAQAQAHAAAQARSSRLPEYRRNATVRSKSTGHGLFTVTLPTTWHVDEAVLCRGTSSSRPYNAYVSFADGDGANMTLTLGDAGVRNSASMNATMAQYGGAIAGVDRTNYGQLPGPRSVSDDYASELAAGLGGRDLECVRELGSDDLSRRQQEAKSVFAKAAQGMPAILRDPFAAEMTRIYTFTLGNTMFKMAIYVRIYAIKEGSGVDLMNPVGLVFGLGEAIGARAKTKRRSKNRSTGRQNADSVAESDNKPICAPGFYDYCGTGTIFWDVAGIATVYAPTQHFDKAYDEAFIPMVHSYWPHDDILSLAASDARQQAVAVQQATNVQIQRMNMQHQAMMAANRQVQAAADARFESWQRQSDAHHAAFRERTNSQFGSSSGAGDWSEAIRGVNTYVTSDGREVQIDVAADRAFENQAGEVIGWSSATDPGSDWTEIPRA